MRKIWAKHKLKRIELTEIKINEFNSHKILILNKKCNIIVIDDFFIDSKHLRSVSVREFYLIKNNKKNIKKIPID